MKFLILILSLLCVAGCSGVPYTTKDKVALGVFLSSQAADIYTTRQCLQAGGRELNPFLDDKPTDKELYLFKAVDTGLFYLLGEVWPEKRQFFYYLGSIVRFGVSINNDQERR